MRTIPYAALAVCISGQLQDEQGGEHVEHRRGLFVRWWAGLVSGEVPREMSQYRIGGIDPSASETLRTLSPDVISRFIYRENVAAFLDASHVSEIGVRRQCHPTMLWVLAGDWHTDGNGEATININRRLCLAHDEESRDLRAHITGEPWLVATPIGDSPVVLTISFTMNSLGSLGSQWSVSVDPPAGGDVEVFEAEVRVKSWQLDGNVAPNTYFAWHCHVQGVRSVYIGG